MNIEPHYIRKKRSLNEILMSASKYLTANTQTLFGSIITFALPFIICPCIIYYIITGSARSFSIVFSYKGVLNPNAFVMLLITYLVYIMGIGLLNMIVNKHLLLREMQELPESNFRKSLSTGFIDEFRVFAMNFLILFVIYSVGMFAVDYILHFVKNTLIPSDDELFSFYSYATDLICITIPSFMVSSLVLYVCVTVSFVSFRDKTDVAESFKKVWYYTKPKLKRVWLSGACFLIIMYALLFFLKKVYFILVALLLNVFGANLSPHIFFGFDLIHTVFIFMVSLFFQIAAVLLFGSLEDEAEGYYMKNKIESV